MSVRVRFISVGVNFWKKKKGLGKIERNINWILGNSYMLEC